MKISGYFLLTYVGQKTINGYIIVDVKAINPNNSSEYLYCRYIAQEEGFNQKIFNLQNSLVRAEIIIQGTEIIDKESGEFRSYNNSKIYIKQIIKE